MTNSMDESGASRQVLAGPEHDQMLDAVRRARPGSLEEARAELAELKYRLDWDAFEPKAPPYILPVTDAGWVYLVRAVGTAFVKIGYTGGAYPHDRIAQLQTASPHELTLLWAFCGPQSDEAELHRVLAHRRVRGEWFELSDQEAETIMWRGWTGDPVDVCPACRQVVSYLTESECCFACRKVAAAQASVETLQ